MPSEDSIPALLNKILSLALGIGYLIYDYTSSSWNLNFSRTVAITLGFVGVIWFADEISARHGRVVSTRVISCVGWFWLLWFAAFFPWLQEAIR